MTFDLKQYIRNIPDFPKPGIQFKDITPILQSPEALQAAQQQLRDAVRDLEFDIVAGIESRGFLFGVSLASLSGKGFVPIRKPGKLPYKTYSHSYQLEYGTDTLEVHQDAIGADQRVLIVDDLLATGGTMAASVELVKKCGGRVAGCAFVVELSFLEGRNALTGSPVRSLISY
ncbi:MAG: adenine phosphoribosyltransferase [Oligoflexus sp.]